jgi:transcriptional regulator with XRE-family HTH domain
MTKTPKQIELNPKQIEVAEIFSRLEKKHGLRKADIARELMIERGYVGYLVTGKRSPSPRTLEQFRELERRLTPTRTRGSAQVELDALIKTITDMQRYDKENYDVAKKVVQSLAPESSFAVQQNSAKLLKKASAAARGGG